MTDPSALWTAEDVARYLRVHPKTVGRLAARRELPSLRVGRSRRFSPAAIRALAEPTTFPAHGARG